MSPYDVVYRPAQPCAVIPITTSLAELGATVPPLNGEVFAWLAARGIAASGPPFWKYEVLDMPRALQLQAGVATAYPIRGDTRVLASQLPAGRYLQSVHQGHPDTLEQATARLLAYAESNGLRFDVVDDPDGERWVARLEYYLTDPAEQPDLNLWQTLLAFKLAD